MTIKNNKGFTLFEIIISIAALSFISVFILQMFISAQSLNTRAKDADTAMSEAITALEGFKTHRSLDDYLAKCGGIVSDIDVSEGSNIVTVLFYYDKNWKRTDTEANVYYCLKMDISAYEETMLTKIKDATYGSLYTIVVEVMESPPDGRVITLASLQSKRYFPTKNTAEWM